MSKSSTVQSLIRQFEGKTAQQPSSTPPLPDSPAKENNPNASMEKPVEVILPALETSMPEKKIQFLIPPQENIDDFKDPPLPSVKLKKEPVPQNNTTYLEKKAVLQVAEEIFKRLPGGKTQYPAFAISLKNSKENIDETIVEESFIQLREQSYNSNVSSNNIGQLIAKREYELFLERYAALKEDKSLRPLDKRIIIETAHTLLDHLPQGHEQSSELYWCLKPFICTVPEKTVQRHWEALSTGKNYKTFLDSYNETAKNISRQLQVSTEPPSRSKSFSETFSSMVDTLTPSSWRRNTQKNNPKENTTHTH